MGQWLIRICVKMKRRSILKIQIKKCNVFRGKIEGQGNNVKISSSVANTILFLHYTMLTFGISFNVFKVSHAQQSHIYLYKNTVKQK